MKGKLPNFGVILHEVKLKGYSDFCITNRQAEEAFGKRRDAYEKFAVRLVAAMDYWGLKLARHPLVLRDRRLFRVRKK